jgi:DNA processing protein
LKTQPSAPPNEPGEIELDKQLLLDCLGYDPTPVDVIVERSGLTADTVSSMLLIVELKGLIAAAGGLYVRLTPGTM